jgi:hypothetical protein
LFYFIIVVANLLPCSIYKLNFITGMYVCIGKNHGMYNAWYPEFQASTVGLGTYSLPVTGVLGGREATVQRNL